VLEEVRGITKISSLVTSRKELLMKREDEVKPVSEPYEEPLLLDAQDLQDVAGGCLAGCSDGSCKKK
jgi:hypothetical protein